MPCDRAHDGGEAGQIVHPCYPAIDLGRPAHPRFIAPARASASVGAVDRQPRPLPAPMSLGGRRRAASTAATVRVGSSLRQQRGRRHPRVGLLPAPRPPGLAAGRGRPGAVGRHQRDRQSAHLLPRLLSCARSSSVAAGVQRRQHHPHQRPIRVPDGAAGGCQRRTQRRGVKDDLGRTTRGAALELHVVARRPR